VVVLKGGEVPLDDVMLRLEEAVRIDARPLGKVTASIEGEHEAGGERRAVRPFLATQAVPGEDTPVPVLRSPEVYAGWLAEWLTLRRGLTA
ncbi:MAG: hypothetical protein ACU0CO_12465, partial [Shimia sp.]